MITLGKIMEIIENLNNRIALVEVGNTVNKFEVIGTEAPFDVKEGEFWWIKVGNGICSFLQRCLISA